VEKIFQKILKSQSKSCPHFRERIWLHFGASSSEIRGKSYR